MIILILITIKTINSVKQSKGIVTCTAKIFNLERKINTFKIARKNFDYDFLIRLNCIKIFFIQNENLKIKQRIQKKFF